MNNYQHGGRDISSHPFLQMDIVCRRPFSVTEWIGGSSGIFSSAYCNPSPFLPSEVRHEG